MAINVLDGQEGSSNTDPGAYGFGRGSVGGVGYNLGAAVSTGYFGFHINRGSFDQAWWTFGGEFTIGYHFGTGVITLYRGNVFNTDPGFTLITSVVAIALDISLWHWVEGTYTAGDAGSVTLFMNGVQYFSVSGVDISLTGSSTISRMTLESAGNNNTSYDNIYHFDSTGPAPYNGNIGEFRILGLLPSGAGSSTQFTPSTGANYACVDELVANSDTDYVYSSAAVKKDLYTFADVGITPAAIYAVALISQGRRDDTQAHTYCNVLKSGVVETNGATRTVSSTYAEYRDYFTHDPNTGLPWDVAKVNALEAGVKLLT